MTRKNRCNLTLRPGIESLERRDVPATWGVPWPEAERLTLSFMPDGSSVQGQSSRLFQKLDSQLGVGKWQTTILDALQTWAVNSNINIGQVADGGQPLGTIGAAQGDPRFGDIRISAIPLPEGIVAMTAPYDLSTGTVSGDMILNSNTDFNSDAGYDLFTVALHEAGHVFGFADSSNPASFMYDVYDGPETKLSSTAVAALRNLYGGSREIIDQDGLFRSQDPARPLDITPLLTFPSWEFPMIGDLATPQDANYFQFKAPAMSSAPQGIDVQIQTAGISQLMPRIVITDAKGMVVGGDSATSKLDGEVSVHLSSWVAGQFYKIRVDGPTDDLHSIGTYRVSLRATSTSNVSDVRFDQATKFAGKGAVGSAPQTAGNSIFLMNQVEHYSFMTPASVPNGVTVQLQAYGIGLVAPRITIYNASGTLAGQAVVIDPNNLIVTITLKNVSPNSGYIVKVANGTVNAFQVGTYQVSVSYNAASSSPPVVPILQTPWLGSDNAKLSTPNTSFMTAAKLSTPFGYAPNTFHAAMAGIDGTATAQFYGVKTPQSSQTGYMTITVQALGSSGLLPWVTIFNKSGVPVPAQVLAQSNGLSVLQVPYTNATDYVIKVAASAANGGKTTGNYHLSTTFGTVASALDPLASGKLGSAQAGAAAAGISASLTTPSPSLHGFVLAGSAANIGTDALLRMTIINSANQVVATMTTLASEAASMNVLLDQDKYSIYIDASSLSGAAIPPLSYSLDGTNLTDPIRIYSSSGAGMSQPTR